MLTTAAATVQPRHLDWNGNLHTKFQGLVESASSEPHSRNPGGKPEVVFNPGRSSCLAAKGTLIEHEHRQAVRSGIDGCGQARGSGTHDRNIVDSVRVELVSEAKTCSSLNIAGASQDRPIWTDHERQLIRKHSKAFHKRLAIAGCGIECRKRIAVPLQKSFKPNQICAVGIPYEHRSDPAILDQSDAPQYKGAHHDLSDLG